MPEKLLLATGFKCPVYIRFVSYFLCLTSLLNNLCYENQVKQQAFFVLCSESTDVSGHWLGKERPSQEQFETNILKVLKIKTRSLT